jgi:hypothetical protein
MRVEVVVGNRKHKACPTKLSCVGNSSHKQRRGARTDYGELFDAVKHVFRLGIVLEREREDIEGACPYAERALPAQVLRLARDEGK